MAKKPTVDLATHVRLLGTCGCKQRCAREQGDEKPNRLGACEVEAEDAGLWTPPPEKDVGEP